MKKVICDICNAEQDQQTGGHTRIPSEWINLDIRASGLYYAIIYKDVCPDCAKKHNLVSEDYRDKPAKLEELWDILVELSEEAICAAEGERI